MVLLLLAAGLMALSLWALATLLGLASAPAAVVVGGLLATVLVLLGVGTAMRGFRRLSAPLDELIAAADSVTAGDYSARVTERGPREVRSMARAFNQMSARLETTDERRRSFLADVSHELRTPLTVIVGQLEAVTDGVYPPDGEHLAPVLDQARLMQRLVEDLRTLALADTGSLPLHREPLDVGALAEETVAGFRALTAAAGVTISASVEPGLPVIPADPARLRGVLDNLLANAIQHTPPGGHIVVAVRYGRDIGHVILEVRDDGSGIPGDLLPHVFERFARGPDSPGSGLGLAIAKDVVTAHEGTISADSEVGHGTTIRVTLPQGTLSERSVRASD
jgi:two-component system sensor histidine kinase BaeS